MHHCQTKSQKKFSGEWARSPPQTTPPLGSRIPPPQTPTPSAPSALRSAFPFLFIYDSNTGLLRLPLTFSVINDKQNKSVSLHCKNLIKNNIQQTVSRMTYKVAYVFILLYTIFSRKITKKWLLSFREIFTKNSEKCSSTFHEFSRKI